MVFRFPVQFVNRRQEISHQNRELYSVQVRGSDIVNSFKQVRMPVYVGSQKCMLEAEIVDLDLPLLISK